MVIDMGKDVSSNPAAAAGVLQLQIHSIEASIPLSQPGQAEMWGWAGGGCALGHP